MDVLSGGRVVEHFLQGQAILGPLQARPVPIQEGGSRGFQAHFGCAVATEMLRARVPLPSGFVF